jgi:uncharacterized protein DUF3305
MNIKSISMPVGVVVRKTPGVTRWAKWNWKAVGVLPGAGPANWVEMRREGDAIEYHAGTLDLELFRSETEAYVEALSCETPMLYVVLQNAGCNADLSDIDLLLVTASPFEAQDYADCGEELVERVVMPAPVVAWVSDFVATHHEHKVFIKRKRDKNRVDQTEDGIGDPRIKQVTDVYRSPSRKTEFIQ